jgi:DNA-directed RNA polymerase specialized sigma24 family protein
VPPPVAENVQQLVQEQKLYDLKHKFDGLSQDQKAAMVDVMSKTVMADKKP